MNERLAKRNTIFVFRGCPVHNDHRLGGIRECVRWTYVRWTPTGVASTFRLNCDWQGPLTAEIPNVLVQQ